jgi:hypothetical protein
MEAMWERVDPTGYREALRRTQTVTQDERMHQLLMRDGKISSAVSASDVVCADSRDVVTRYDAASKAVLGLDISEDEKRLLDETIRRNLYTNYGTASEHRALVKVRELLGIQAGKDDTFYKSEIGNVGDVGVWVGGKIDAITDDRTLVLEIKNRIRHLFHKIPFYEQIQLQTYLHLLDVTRGAIVECLTTPADSFINVVPIRRNKQLWEQTIVPKIFAFVRVFIDLLGDEAFQDAFVTSTKKTLLVQGKISAAEKARV